MSEVLASGSRTAGTVGSEARGYAVANVFPVVATGTQGADAPTTHTVGTTTVESFLERQHVTVTIGDGDTRSHVECEALAAVKVMRYGIVGIGFDILGVADA